MWDPRRLTTLRFSSTSYKESFTCNKDKFTFLRSCRNTFPDDKEAFSSLCWDYGSSKQWQLGTKVQKKHCYDIPNSARRRVFVTDGFHGLHHSLQASDGILRQIMPWLLPSTSFTSRFPITVISLGPPLWSSDQSSWLQIQWSGFDSRRYQIFSEVVGLEWSPLSLVRITEEQFQGNSGSGLENWN
jgi:hypothetical protein